MIMTEDTNSILRTIKQHFRLLMNGVISSSMRDKGVDYHLNWGVSLPHLTEMAKEYGKNYPLALALWKENIRECKILATMIMPHEKMSRDIVEQWGGEIPSIELAEISSFYLFGYLSFASEIANEWITSDLPMKQICGFHIYSRLFVQGFIMQDQHVEPFLANTLVALKHQSLAIKHAAFSCLQRFAQQSVSNSNIVEKTCKNNHLELF